MILIINIFINKQTGIFKIKLFVVKCSKEYANISQNVYSFDLHFYLHASVLWIGYRFFSLLSWVHLVPIKRFILFYFIFIIREKFQIELLNNTDR